MQTSENNKKVSPPRQPQTNPSQVEDIKNRLLQKYRVAKPTTQVPNEKPTETSEKDNNTTQPPTPQQGPTDKVIEKPQIQSVVEKVPTQITKDRSQEKNQTVVNEKPQEKPSSQMQIEKPQIDKPVAKPNLQVKNDKPPAERKNTAEPGMQNPIDRTKSNIKKIIAGNVQEANRQNLDSNNIPPRSTNPKPDAATTQHQNPPQGTIISLSSNFPSTIIKLPTTKKPEAQKPPQRVMNPNAVVQQPKPINNNKNLSNNQNNNNTNTNVPPPKIQRKENEQEQQNKPAKIPRNPPVESVLPQEQQKTTVVVNKPPAQNSNPIPNENNQKKNKPKQAELKPTEKTVISKEKENTAVVAATVSKPNIPEKVAPNPQRIEVETEKPSNEKPNLKRKPEVDVDTLRTSVSNLPDKKKPSNEKAKSIDNSSSPKSIKSNISEKTVPVKIVEEKAKVAKKTENVKTLRNEIEEIKNNKKIVEATTRKTIEPPKSQESYPVTHSSPKIKPVDKEISTKKNQPTEEPNKNAMIIEESSTTNPIDEKKADESTFVEKPKVVENTRMEEEPSGNEELKSEKMIEEISMTVESNEKEGEKENFMEYEAIRNKMMELEDVVKKVEAKMKKEELEVLALEYEENMKKSYSQRLCSLFEFFKKY